VSGNLLALLRELSQRDIEYIVVGGMAGVLHGAPVVTADLDIVHRRTQENVAKLLVLLGEIDAIFRGDDRRLKPNESHLLGRGHVLLTTKLGQLDVLCEVSEQAYEELEPFAVSMSLGEQLTVRVVGLEKLIELKAAAGRPKDQVALPVLRATLAETKRRM